MDTTTHKPGDLRMHGDQPIVSRQWVTINGKRTYTLCAQEWFIASSANFGWRPIPIEQAASRVVLPSSQQQRTTGHPQSHVKPEVAAFLRKAAMGINTDEPVAAGAVTKRESLSELAKKIYFPSIYK
jgi:hypothetical protein